MFLLLLLFATQLAYDLYATSAVSGAAHDAARRVAGFDAADQRAAVAAQESATLRQRLAARGQRQIRIDWELTAPDHVAIRVRAVHPSLLPATWSARTPLGVIDRTITVHREER